MGTIWNNSPAAGVRAPGYRTPAPSRAHSDTAPGADTYSNTGHRYYGPSAVNLGGIMHLRLNVRIKNNIRIFGFCQIL